MSDLKHLHAGWIVEIYEFLRQQKGSILNRFDKVFSNDTNFKLQEGVRKKVYL